MHIQFNPFRSLPGLAAMVALFLAGCGGGGGNGPAILATPQTVLFAVVPTLPFGGTATVRASASSALPVNYSTISPTVCSVNALTGLVTNLSVGTCVVAADQPGNDVYAPATQATQRLVVLFDPAQTISFGTAPTLTLFGSTTVTATASSGLAVRYTSATPGICSVNETTGAVTNIAAGVCTIAANQAGNTNYNPAPQATQSITVAPWVGPVTVSGAPTAVSATAGSTSNTTVVSFNGPESSGGSRVTGFTVSSNPSGITVTASNSPVTVTCPGSCAGYTFAVLATNGVGNSAPSAWVNVLTNYRVTARFFEPDTQPNDSIFTGTFTLNSSTQTVTLLQGNITESMTGPPMTTVPLQHQLSAISDGMGGLRVTTFALNTTNVFSEGGFAASSPGLYFGWPTATNPSAGGVGNAFVTIHVNLANPTAALTQSQINQLAYGDCASGGMMGDTCMTGYSGIGTMGGYPVAQSITRE